MTMNPLPPQAYTKETMLKAYQWLMVQNSSIKEMATTPDILVSLYLKATRDGDHSLDRPSIQNFKNELKSLAGMMGELDRPVMTAAAAAAVQAQPMMAPAHQVHHAHQMHQATVAPTPAVTPQPMVSTTLPATQTQVSYTEKTLTTTSHTQDLVDLLDCGSKTMIQEVKNDFNLSSDLEALRMLIKVGYSRSKALLK